MKVIGIAAEYDPFHNGHEYHIRRSVEMTGADAVVAVMSGDFTQRGEPALADKWTRARAACEAGADLALELPFIYACNNSDMFARGAVGILNGLGCVDYMSFGSESGDVSRLAQAAEALARESDDFRAALRSFAAEGYSYPRARAAALAACGRPDLAELLDSPNNVLAIDYIRHLILSDSRIEPITVKREGAPYDSAAMPGPAGDLSETQYPSATALRRMISGMPEATVGEILWNDLSQYMPAGSLEAFGNAESILISWQEAAFDLIRAKILTSSEEEISAIYACGEGMAKRAKAAVRHAESLAELSEAILSRRYTKTRVSRFLAQLLIGLKREDVLELTGTYYARVLAFNEKGAQLLRHIRKTGCASIPVITNLNKDIYAVPGFTAAADNTPAAKITRALEYDVAANDIYGLISGRNLYSFADRVREPERAGAL